MDETFDFIDDMNKKLSHTITDLDDIRHVMSALKVIREIEIKIDMGIGPIEVRVGVVADGTKNWTFPLHQLEIMKYCSVCNNYFIELSFY